MARIHYNDNELFLANERTQSTFYVLGLASVSLEGGVLEFRESVWLKGRVATAKQKNTSHNKKFVKSILINN